eukprot:TRINITY_DN27505_c0_g1_i1.p1 TRINITY_DN27505_c0_g1~~TRINITY_DN27505_c0_g1_i1.p1  ORF type:complete len:121 (-),score=30.73 TRINITY_DN27505_c0_g1_i1:95-457(-)
MSKVWASCRCFYERHIYLKQINAHVEFSSEAKYVDFSSEEKFLQEYSDILENADKQEVLKEVKQEINRRKGRFLVMDENRKLISNQYHPLHKQLFETPPKLKLESFEPKKLFEGSTAPLF